MNNKGITLIEMIGVFMILIVVLMLAMPSIRSAVEKTKNDKYKSYEELIKMNMELYVHDKIEGLTFNNGYLPLTLNNLKEVNPDINLGICSINNLYVRQISTCVNCSSSDPIYNYTYDYCVNITCTDGSEVYNSSRSCVVP